MYNLFRCKNEDGSSVAKKNALRRLKSSLNSNEMTKRFSGHQQNVSVHSVGVCLDIKRIDETRCGISLKWRIAYSYLVLFLGCT